MKKSNLLILMLTTISFNVWASEQPSGQSSSPKAQAGPVVPHLNFESTASNVSPTGVPLSESSIASHRRTAAPSPANSDASDTKRAVENLDDASKERNDFVASAFDIALAMDRKADNHKAVALISRLSSKTLFGLNPHVLTSPQVRHISRPTTSADKAQEELATNNHHRKLLTAISEIPKADGTIDISDVQREVILHFSQSINSHHAKAQAEGNTATAPLRLDPQNAELLRIKAELQAELMPVVAEELRDRVMRKSLTKRLKPSVEKQLRTELTPKVEKELAAELRAKQKKRSDYWGYAACAGVGCVIGWLGYWAYSSMSGTKSTKTASK